DLFDFIFKMATWKERCFLCKDTHVSWPGFSPRPYHKLAIERPPHTDAKIKVCQKMRCSVEEGDHWHVWGYHTWLDIGRLPPIFRPRPDKPFDSNTWRWITCPRKNSMAEPPVPPPSYLGGNTYIKLIEGEGLFMDQRHKQRVLMQTQKEMNKCEQLKLRSECRVPPLDMQGNIMPPRKFKSHQSQGGVCSWVEEIVNSSQKEMLVPAPSKEVVIKPLLKEATLEPKVYAPTTDAEEAKVDQFYEDLQHLLEITPQNDVLIIMGNWNAKKIGDIKGTFQAKAGMIKAKNGRDLTEAEGIKKRWQHYTEENKDLTIPDNHNDVTTDLKPDILQTYADDTTLMAECEEERKSLLMRVKDESTKVDLKLNIKQTKILASGPITSWQIHREEMEKNLKQGDKEQQRLQPSPPPHPEHKCSHHPHTSTTVITPIIPARLQSQCCECKTRACSFLLHMLKPQQKITNLARYKNFSEKRPASLSAQLQPVTPPSRGCWDCPCPSLQPHYQEAAIKFALKNISPIYQEVVEKYQELALSGSKIRPSTPVS
ncbi:Testis-expressed protein 52, partial [Varanus komodoensis]